MPVSDNLPQLRDIHLPDGVSFWPIAYGWWVILFSVIAFIILLWLWKYLRRKSKKLYALRQLKKLEGNNSVKSAAIISQILRRICVYKYPMAVGLSGEKWMEFLQQHGKATLSENMKNILSNAPYMPDNESDFDNEDMAKLYEFGKSWIGENL